MLNIYRLLILISIFSFSLISCSDDLEEMPSEEVAVCDTDRYTKDLFSDYEMTTLKFGENFNQDGKLIELYMDVYTPASDDVEMRPAIVWAFGGAFISGRRRDIEDLALQYVKKGFVCATFDYRLIEFTGTVPDSTQATDIAIKATQDMRAAIRELKKDAATDNIFKVDPDLIFAGGVSAGAITALQTAIMDESDLEDDIDVKAAVLANGGLKGATGDAENQSYDSQVAGIINFSGAILRLEFYDPGDPPVISYHGDADLVVKYDYDYAEVFFNRIIRLYGSGAFHPYLDQIGIKNQLYTLEGGGHVDIYSDASFASDREAFRIASAAFLREELCM